VDISSVVLFISFSQLFRYPSPQRRSHLFSLERSPLPPPPSYLLAILAFSFPPLCSSNASPMRHRSLCPIRIRPPYASPRNNSSLPFAEVPSPVRIRKFPFLHFESSLPGNSPIKMVSPSGSSVHFPFLDPTFLPLSPLKSPLSLDRDPLEKSTF